MKKNKNLLQIIVITISIASLTLAPSCNQTDEAGKNNTEQTNDRHVNETAGQIDKDTAGINNQLNNDKTNNIANSDKTLSRKSKKKKEKIVVQTPDNIKGYENQPNNDKATIAIIDFDMVYVEGGTFTMGNSEEQTVFSAEEKPTHSVTLSNYMIGKYEVTQKQWEEVMGNNPSCFIGNNNPVEQVNWNDIQEFITKLNAKTGKNYRLPTEAEWEYAARGGNKSKGYKYSGSNTLADVAWYSENSGNTTHPIGEKRANELGIYDMSGNVWEWCSDWYDSYSSEEQNNPQGPAHGNNRVDRGGSWINYAKGCRVTIRINDGPDYRNNTLGFRLAMDAE